jgi:P-type Ca2+ transporter type 2C
VARPTGAPAPSLMTAADGRVWHTLSAGQVVQAQGVDARRGLSSAEAASRAQRFGPNTFAAGTTESRWRAFARQYADPMQVVLLIAGIGSFTP